MKPSSEAGFQATVIAYARLRHWRCAHFRSVRVQRRDGTCFYETPIAADGRGFPDLILTRGPRIVAAELKAPRGRLSADQVAWLAALAAAGVETYRWRPKDWKTIEEILE